MVYAQGIALRFSETALSCLDRAAARRPLDQPWRGELNMCLIVIAWQQHAEFPLIVASNRDEFHSRPTESAHWWPDESDILAGRDLQAGGTWFALHRDGRFAAVTNYRDADAPSARDRSRGHLVTEFLLGADKPLDYLSMINGADYAGFNLVVSDSDSLAYLSNRENKVHDLQAGVYGLANELLDSPWHKVLRSKESMQRLVSADKVNETELLRLLDDRKKAPASTIESSRLPFATAHAISAPFIVLPDYGTRCSTVAIRNAGGGWVMRERRFDAAGKNLGESGFSISDNQA